MKILNVDYTEYENEFVKDKIPKFILDVLLFRHSKFAKYYFLNERTQKKKAAIGHVNQTLENRKKINYKKIYSQQFPEKKVN